MILYDLFIAGDGGKYHAVLTTDDGYRFTGSSREAWKRALDLAQGRNRRVRFTLDGGRGFVGTDGVFRRYVGGDEEWIDVDTSAIYDSLADDDATGEDGWKKVVESSEYAGAGARWVFNDYRSKDGRRSCSFVDVNGGGGIDSAKKGWREVVRTALDIAKANGSVDARQFVGGEGKLGELLPDGTVRLSFSGDGSRLPHEVEYSLPDVTFNESAPDDGRARYLAVVDFDSDLGMLFLKRFGKQGELLLKLEARDRVDGILERAYEVAADPGEALVSYQIVVEQDGVPVCFEAGTVTPERTLVPQHSEEQEEFNQPADGESLKDSLKESYSGGEPKSVYDSPWYRRRGIPYIGVSDPGASDGRRTAGCAFWYFVTPSGRISKYWTAATFKDGMVNEERIRRWEKEWTSRYRSMLDRGYSLSDPYLYSGKFEGGKVEEAAGDRGVAVTNVTEEFLGSQRIDESDVFRGFDLDEELPDGSSRYHVLNTSTHVRAGGQFNRRIAASDVTVDGVPYAEAVRAAGVPDEEASGLLSEDAWRIVGRMSGKCVVERIPSKDGRSYSYSIVSPWMPDGAYDDRCLLKIPFLDRFKGREVAVGKFGLHVVPGVPSYPKDGNSLKVYVDDPEKAGKIWGDLLPSDLVIRSFAIPESAEECPLTRSEVIDQMMPQLGIVGQLEDPERRTLEDGADEIYGEFCSRYAFYSEPVLRRRYNLMAMLEKVVGTYLLNHGRRRISCKGCDAAVSEAVGKDDGRMDWYLEIRDQKAKDATLYRSDPEDDATKEYDGASAIRKAKELVRAGIQVAASLVKAGPGPWDRRMLADGFLLAAGDGWEIVPPEGSRKSPRKLDV